MKRRYFLKTTVVAAGALLTGCGDTTSDAQAAPADASADGAATGDDTGSETTLESAGSPYFPQSVASGDPRPSTVVLWTRVVDPAQTADLAVALEVALDEAFAQPIDLSAAARTLEATAAHDGCVRVRLEGLAAQTTYWYRFRYTAKDGTTHTSRAGRTKTAPAPDADLPVTFAFASCQDFNGHYYNAWQRLLQVAPDLDFVVHLGDYVYETTGNPSFQDTAEGRHIQFSDTAGAIRFETETGAYYAARSLSNYRELYQQYRSDRQLQRVHERYPMIAVWDDHEFSDDAHGATATYTGGREDETDIDRRKAATQAWFEYMPIDFKDQPDFEYDPSVAFPSDIRIWRDFDFGQHLHLAMTDLRSRRADHLIPEDAFPGAVNLTQAELSTAFGEVPTLAIPYVDIESYAGGVYQPFLKAIGAAQGRWLEADISGNISVAFINDIIQHATEAGTADLPPLIQDTAELPRGLAWHLLGKTAKYANVGARYLVIKDTYDLYAKTRYLLTEGQSEEMMGQEQRDWFLASMTGSDRTWKVWGNEFCLLQEVIDLRGVDTLGPAFQQRFYVNCEDWTNQPNRRDMILDALGPIDNVVAITGDIHAFLAGVPTSRNDSVSRVVELVGAGISSTSLRTLMMRIVQSSKTLPPEAIALAAGVGGLITDPYTQPNPDFAYARPDVQGISLVTVTPEYLSCRFHIIPEKFVTQDLGEDLGGHFEIQEFVVKAGEKALYRRVDGGALRRWSPEAFDWV